MPRWFLLIACLVWAAALPAVQHTGFVRSSGQPVPGATVTATQGENKIVTSTDETGGYRFEDLSPGNWVLEVEMPGFAKARREVTIGVEAKALEWDLELGVQTPAARRPDPAKPRVDFQALALSQTTESQIDAALASTSAAAPIQESPSDANEAFLVTGSLSRGLEFAREENAFAMRPGPFGQRPGGPGGEGVPGSPEFSDSQGPPGGGFVGRGGFGGGGGFGGRGGMRPGVGPGGGPGGGRGDRPGARRFPRGRPGEVNFGNRRNRGRDTFRGSVFFSLRNSALDARPYSLTGQTVEKPSYARSRFGFAGGGQLRIPKLIDSDKTFVFGNYFGTRSRNPFSAVSTVPSLAEREGDFSQSIAGGPVTIFDPTSRLPFPGNRMPSERIDAAARGLLEFFPMPNQPGQVQNYQYVTSVPQNTDNLGLRLMHSLTQSDRLSGSFNLQRRNSENAQLYGFRDEMSGQGFNLDLRWMHNLGPRLINNLRWSFSRNRSETVPFFAYKDNVAARLGIKGTSQEPVNYGPPNLNFTNFGSLTDASPSLRRDQTFGVGDGITLVKGKHNFSFGGEYRRSQLNSRTEQNARGTFTFSGLATSAFDDRGQPLDGTGFDLSDFLLGFPQSSSVRFGSANTYFRGTVYNAYAQDDWRPLSNLTLNVGIRYEFFTPLREKYGRIANLDIAPSFTGVAVVTPDAVGPYTGSFPEALIDPDKNNLSPRVGVAWRPFSKSRFLIRAGHGVYYNGSIYNQFPSRLASQPPFANTATLSTTVMVPLTIRDGFATSPSTEITNTYAVDRRYRTPYAQTWNLAVQQELPRAFVLELGYLGTKGTRLDIQRLPNRAAPGSPLTAEQRRQIGNAVGFTFDSSEGNSIYHAAQVRVTRRFRRGLSANALYTWSKSIDNASTFGGGGGVVAQNDKDLSAERGLSSFDRRHTLNLFYLISSPFGERGTRMQAGGWPVRFLEDWRLSGGVTFNSGTPLTARVLGNRSDSGGTGSVGSGRADATGQPVDSGTGFFNTAAFAVPPAGRFGNASRNSISGPGLFALNLSLSRSFRLGEERRRIELRMEATNATNHVSYTNLGTTVNASDYGLATAAAPMRTIALTVRYRF